MLKEGFLIAVLFSLAPLTALAHVVVTPETAGVASFQHFSVGVPNEREMPVESLRLVVPEGISHVEPAILPGFTITTKTEGEGDAARVTEVVWQGAIPAGQRADFGFSAKLPATPQTLAWKAYQTYADGQVVAWEAAPGAAHPASVTEVRDDLTEAPDEKAAKSAENTARQALVLAAAALVLSSWTLFDRRKKSQT
jgi:uncharacterized protein YcnI